MIKLEWECNVCGSRNPCVEGECDSCDCGGSECKRDSCSDPQSFVEKKEES